MHQRISARRSSSCPCAVHKRCAQHMMAAAITGPLAGADDIMVYKSADPKEVGSITSSNSFLRNA